MFKEIGQMAGLLKNLPKIREEMEKFQSKLGDIKAEGDAGGGMVKVTMTGQHNVKKVQLEPTVVSEDREMLEDLIAAATNDAVKKVEARIQEKMASVMGGMQLPPGMKLPL